VFAELIVQHSQLPPPRHRLRAVVDIELGVDVVDVPFHRAGGDKKLAADFGIG